MVDLDDIRSDVVAVSSERAPVKIAEADHEAMRELQSLVDALNRYRQEMGRLLQLLGNMREEANKVEVSLSEKRKDLAKKYNLEHGQWALDFDKREFVLTAKGAPVIP